MDKVSFSWSKPGNLPNLIGRKKVDLSVFKVGSHIPVPFHDEFRSANGGETVPRGKSRPVVLVYAGREFKAILANTDRRSVSADTLQLNYATDKAFLRILQTRFRASYAFLTRPETQRSQRAPEEYIDFYHTEVPYRYRVEFVTELDATLQALLDRGKETHQPGSTTRDHFLSSLFDSAASSLAQSSVVKAFPNIQVTWSLGTGIVSAVPWIALLDQRETTTTQSGVYVVLLFRADMSGFYVAYQQGITELKNQYGGAQARVKMLERAQELRQGCFYLHTYGFHLDNQLDLRGKTYRAKAYEDSTIAYKLYEDGHLPDDERFFADLSAVLKAYTEYVEGVEAPISLVAAASETMRTVKITPRAESWPEYLTRDYIAVGWDEIGDLNQFTTWEQFLTAFRTQYRAQYQNREELIRAKARELWTLRELNPGDRIVANRGNSEVLAVGTVLPPGYAWHPERPVDKHTLAVAWDTNLAKHIPSQRQWSTTTICAVPDWLQKLILEEPAPHLDLSTILGQFSTSLKASNISFGGHHEELTRSFVASLATRRLVILTGLSGSGKTQLALRFGDWLGEHRCLLVPVRPDWTGSEALFGYVDALVPAEEGRRAWFVPKPLAFMLQAAADPANPYLLILDEMNLAHVERYFADVLSGMESDQPCLPNLVLENGIWRDAPKGPDQIPLPQNLFIVGTVNVDETTYMFSPKVLDRANTFEFRVSADDLVLDAPKPTPCAAGDLRLVRGFYVLAADENWHLEHPLTAIDLFAGHLRTLHTLLSHAGAEFGHRLFRDALRFAALMQSAGSPNTTHTLDRVVMQKILPRLHGTRRQLDEVLCALGEFCFDPSAKPTTTRFDPQKPPAGVPALPASFDKVQRMIRSLRMNQFASFTE